MSTELKGASQFPWYANMKNRRSYLLVIGFHEGYRSAECTMLLKIETERVAREMGLPYYCVYYGAWSQAGVVNHAREAKGILLINSSTDLIRAVPDSRQELHVGDSPDLRLSTLRACLEPWRCRGSSEYLLLGFCGKEEILVYGMARNSNQTVFREKLSPILIGNIIWGDTPLVENLFSITDQTSALPELDRLICFMELMGHGKTPSKATYRISDMVASCPWRPALERCDYSPFQAFVRLFLVNPHLMLLERWLCSRPDGENGSLKLMKLTDKIWGFKVSSIEPTIRVKGIGHGDSLIVGGVQGDGIANFRRRTRIAEGLRNRLREYAPARDPRFLIVEGLFLPKFFEEQGKSILGFKVGHLNPIEPSTRGKGGRKWTLLDLRLKTVEFLNLAEAPSFILVIGTDPYCTRAILCSSTTGGEVGSSHRTYYRERSILLEPGATEGFFSFVDISISPWPKPMPEMGQI